MIAIARMLAVVFFLFGVALVVRAFRAEKSRQGKYLKAAAGAMAVSAGNALLPNTTGLVCLVIGIWLVYSAGRM